MTHPVLSALGLTGTESGTYLGRGEWSATTDAGVLEPVNPSTGEVIGKVYASSASDYETIHRARPGRFHRLAQHARPEARRSHPPLRRSPAHP